MNESIAKRQAEHKQTDVRKVKERSPVGYLAGAEEAGDDGGRHAVVEADQGGGSI